MSSSSLAVPDVARACSVSAATPVVRRSLRVSAPDPIYPSNSALYLTSIVSFVSPLAALCVYGFLGALSTPSSQSRDAEGASDLADPVKFPTPVEGI